MDRLEGTSGAFIAEKVALCVKNVDDPSLLPD
jgi:hypothetical protein